MIPKNNFLEDSIKLLIFLKMFKNILKILKHF